MAKKSSIKTLGASYETILSNPAAIKSIVLCNKSDKDCRASIRIKRGRDSYSLAERNLKPGESTPAIDGDPKSISLEGTDELEARATDPSSVDIMCSYEETAGHGPLFNMASWNDREAWAHARGAEDKSAPPEFVRRGLDEGAWRWRNFCAYKNWVYEETKSLLPGWEGLEMERYTEISSENGYLASCGVNLHVRSDEVINAVSFRLQVNSFYSATLTPEEWGDAIAHQMGHALGLGIFWLSPIMFLSKGNFPSAQRVYNSISNLDRNMIPLEDLKSLQSPSAHWSDSFFVFNSLSYPGLENEIMIARHPRKKMLISRLSVAALKDFGYQVQSCSEGEPDLSTSIRTDEEKAPLKCGLSSKNSGKMMRMLKSQTLNSSEKLSLNKYILS